MDLDGVVYRGAEAVPGAVELIETLRAAGIRVRYATNNSMATRAQYAERLVGHGIPALSDEIVTSTSATISFLQRRLPEVHRVLGAGAPALSSELRAEGFDEISASELARPDYQGELLGSTFDAVIVGLDQASTYGRVAVVATAIRQGARFIATNADLRYPTAKGLLPGAGSLVAAIRAAAGGDVEPIVIGKPGTAMFTGILADAGVAAEDAVVVGDNPDSDIIAARRAGIFAILVLTGVADAVTARGLEGERRPDLVVADPWELRERFGEWLT
jgi:HAD superfamily hydrolase (TIGR01450 family)